MSQISTERQWVEGKLRDEISGVPKGTIIAVRRSSLKLKCGPTWWIVVPRTKKVIHVAESYGGHGLYQLVSRSNPIRSAGPKSSDLLDRLVVKFETLPDKPAIPSNHKPSKTQPSNLKSMVRVTG
jgi:hypothetical protein